MPVTLLDTYGLKRTHAAAASFSREGKGVMFVALSRFVVANGMDEEVKQAFENRPHLVDSAPGFVRLDVITPVDNGAEIWLITYWQDETSYRTWHRGHSYHVSHRGIPKGLKLVPNTAELRFFHHVSS